MIQKTNSLIIKNRIVFTKRFHGRKGCVYTSVWFFFRSVTVASSVIGIQIGDSCPNRCENHTPLRDIHIIPRIIHHFTGFPAIKGDIRRSCDSADDIPALIRQGERTPGINQRGVCGQGVGKTDAVCGNPAGTVKAKRQTRGKTLRHIDGCFPVGIIVG